MPKARNLKLFTATIKMSYRYCDWSHYKITWWDRIIIWFSDYEWIRSPSGKPEPIIRTKRWKYRFTSNQRLAEVERHRQKTAHAT